MRRAHGAILGILLASVAVPAFAADMPVKAPAPAAPIIDWSGVYSGFAVGGAWGREKLDHDVGSFDDPTLISSQLFGTSAARILDGTPTLIAPPFVMNTCLLSNCNAIKMSGIMAGGFAGVQKQWGNWVVGLEGSWDWLSLKKTLSASEVEIQPVNRFVISDGGLPVLQSPQPTAVVTRTASVSSKIDQVADIRGKVGLANTFLGPNILLYATSGASIAHVQHALTLTQNVQRINPDTGATIGTPRFNEFDAVSGDTRLGWVVGAGFDWKLTPNLILGVLYRHHEFPKGTVAFNDATNTVGFGTSRVSLDSVQGRMSYLFPIQ
jgi:outer membrane immunogenic protein